MSSGTISTHHKAALKRREDDASVREQSEGTRGMLTFVTRVTDVGCDWEAIDGSVVDARCAASGLRAGDVGLDNVPASFDTTNGVRTTS